MTETSCYDVRSPDGRAIFGLESTEAAETAAGAYGEGQTARVRARKRGRDEIAVLPRPAGATDFHQLGCHLGNVGITG